MSNHIWWEVKAAYRHSSRRQLIAYVLAVLLVVVVLAQLLVPSGYILPRSYIGPEPVGFRKKQEIQRELEQKSSIIKIAYGKKTVSVPAAEAGIATNTEKTINNLPALSWQDRIIPLRPLYLSFITKTVEPVVEIDRSKLKAYAEKAAQTLRKEPVDATAAVVDGNLVLTDDISGLAYDARKIETALSRSNPYTDTPIDIRPTVLPAATKKTELLPLKESYRAKTAVPLRVQYGNITRTVSPDELKKWLTVTQIPGSEARSLGFIESAVDAQIQAWAKEYNVSPGITQVRYLDDVVVSQVNGAAGRALDTAAIKTQLNQWLAAPSETPVMLASTALAPRVVATRTYSFSSAQLQAKLNAWIAANPGKYQVAIRELNGRGREASHNVAQQTVMASTYKIFLAFAAYKQAESGALSLGAKLPGGVSIGHCINIMIVNSENACAVELGRYIGWAKVDQIIAAAGFKGTILNNYDANGNLKGDKLVNATQQASFLAQLSAGSLINATHTGQLLGYMKLQTYREGIPAGSRGAAVADKVGFLDNYIHDVGIVYGPKSTYAIVIMSEGSSWSRIRNLAEAVYDFMSQ